MTPSGEATVAAPANIAFVKYWGSRDPARGLPENRSISMTLSRCRSVCTAVFLPEGDGAPEAGAGEATRDEVLRVDERGVARPAPEPFAAPVRSHLARIRRWAGAAGRFRIATRNSFPTGAGLASSASGFAALTLAAARAVGREAAPEELSDLARRSGSGSAARSLFGGYVEWPAAGPRDRASDGEGSGGDEALPASPIAPPDHWDLRDLIAVVAEGAKEVPSREGHRRVLGSPYFRTRLELLPERLEEVRRAIADRDFDRLAPVLEREAVDLHFLAMSARPPIHYWVPGTLEVLAAVRELRAGGVPVAWTMDAGPNVHVICPAESEEAVRDRLAGLPAVRSLIRDRVGPGPSSEAEPLL